jgi:hypothetical protein
MSADMAASNDATASVSTKHNSISACVLADTNPFWLLLL